VNEIVCTSTRLTTGYHDHVSIDDSSELPQTLLHSNFASRPAVSSARRQLASTFAGSSSNSRGTFLPYIDLTLRQAQTCTGSVAPAQRVKVRQHTVLMMLIE
jgi:hypothetical protein